jgi:predicted RNase H-like nuclease (RuvC/YqgF family)
MSIEESRSVEKPCESPPETDMSKKQIESALRQKQREARELHHQLRAADDARLDKEQRIGTLLERCRELEREAAEKASTIEKLHSKIARSSSLSPPSD